MKKKFWTLVSMSFIMLCVFVTATACGGPTKTYKACYEYLQNEGGSEKLEDLKDPYFKSIDIEFTNGDGSMTAKFSWADTSSYSLAYTFYESDNQYVDIEYTTIYIGYTIQVTVLEGTCTDLTDISTYETLAVASGTATYEENDPLYEQKSNEVKKYIPRTVSWITAAIRVLLDDDSLSVQDLYDPS